LPMADDVGPEVRRRIRDMLADENLEISMTSLAQKARVVLDIVKFLDRGEADYESPATPTKSWRSFLVKEAPLMKAPDE
jgi:hypothetical protein